MKNVLIGIFAGISALSLGYIAYDEFIKEEKVIYKECNKEELCDECICDDVEDEVDDNPIIDADTIYDKNGKELYNLTVYNASKIKNENVKINNKTLKLENKDGILYVNNKKVSEYADAIELYVTNNYILGFHTACQIGICEPFVIYANGNVEEIDIGKFDGYEVYLANNGDLISIGEEYCGLDCSGDKMILRFSYNNGKVQAITEKLK